jgi:hypothetical protein
LYFGTGRLSHDQVGGGNKFHRTRERTALKVETGGMNWLIQFFNGWLQVLMDGPLKELVNADPF